ncbi:hypothetical protein GCM10022223_68280 [Kineosporia mesophila]|uniref:Uncharacterized protein n=1 Tax=Kineosporia mesophila TaxID=566012 RepID=A0ABP7ATT9_9ACTN
MKELSGIRSAPEQFPVNPVRGDYQDSRPVLPGSTGRVLLTTAKQSLAQRRRSSTMARILKARKRRPVEKVQEQPQRRPEDRDSGPAPDQRG